MRPAPLPRDSLRHRDVARRPRPGAARRGVGGRDADERRPRSERGRPRLPGSAGGDPQAAQYAPSRHRPVLPHRSGRRCVARRHGRDPRLGHERGALRDDAGERAGADRGARRRARREDRGARPQVRRRLRPHPAVRGLRRHPGGDHRDPAPPLRHPRGRLRGGVLVRLARRRGRHRHPDDPVRGARRADRAARRGADGCRQPLLGSRLPGLPDPVLRVPRKRTRGPRAGGARRCSWRARTPGESSGGRRARRTARACGRRATTPTTRRSRYAPARRHGRRTSASPSRTSPSASWRPAPTSTLPGCWPRSSATSGTGTSISPSSSTPTTPKGSRGRRR